MVLSGKRCRARGKRLNKDLGVSWPSSCHDTSPRKGTQRNERNRQGVDSNVGFNAGGSQQMAYETGSQLERSRYGGTVKGLNGERLRKDRQM